jgi:hypothetical protein
VAAQIPGAEITPAENSEIVEINAKRLIMHAIAATQILDSELQNRKELQSLMESLFSVKDQRSS